MKPVVSKTDNPAVPSRRRVRVAKGIYKDRHGLATTVKVNGVQRELRSTPGTPLKTIQARRDALRASLRTRLKQLSHWSWFFSSTRPSRTRPWPSRPSRSCATLTGSGARSDTSFAERARDDGAGRSSSP